ncbi:hypothetical protein D3C78_953780 [compost metagenome]
MVVGKRHRQRIQAELHERAGEAGDEQHLKRHLRHDRQGQRRQRQANREAANQQCPVIAVRQPAQRPLHHQAGKDAATHEQTHLLGGQALLRGIERCQTIERADNQPGPQYRAERLRHPLHEEAWLHWSRVQGRRVNAPGQGHRHQAQGKTQRHQHQQLRPQGRVHDQNQLTQHQAQVGGDHIAAEHHAALLGVSLLVQPALDDHVLAHHAQPHDHPQHQPGREPVDQPVTEHRRADDPRTGRISPDMPDPGNQPVTDFSAQHQAEIVGGHQCTNPQTVDMVRGEAQRQVGTE